MSYSGITVSISESPFVKIARDKYAKPKVMVCSVCDAVATHRIEKEEFGVVVHTHYCKQCFEQREY